MLFIIHGVLKLNPFTAGVSGDVMEFCKVSPTFASADKILLCDHSNESSLPVLTYGAICFSRFHKIKFRYLVEICFWVNLAVKGLIKNQ